MPRKIDKYGRVQPKVKFMLPYELVGCINHEKQNLNRKNKELIDLFENRSEEIKKQLKEFGDMYPEASESLAKQYVLEGDLRYYIGVWLSLQMVIGRAALGSPNYNETWASLFTKQRPNWIE